MEQSLPVQLNNLIDTSPTLVHGEGMSYRYAYARSRDSRSANEPGQDYLTFQESKTSFSFALCDGVSQSFFGELAAQFAGNVLLSWLGTIGEISTTSALQDSLHQCLQEKNILANKKVLEYPLPGDLGPFLVSVLEDKRAQGSETTFLSGRIDLPSKASPLGRVVFSWIGDSRIRFWGPRGERSKELGDNFLTRQRWSTKHGVVGGNPHIFLSPLIDEKSEEFTITRIMAYSDGLLDLNNITQPLSNLALKTLMLEADLSATSDDISFLEIWIGPVPEIVDSLVKD